MRPNQTAEISPSRTTGIISRTEESKTHAPPGLKHHALKNTQVGICRRDDRQVVTKICVKFFNNTGTLSITNGLYQTTTRRKATDWWPRKTSISRIWFVIPRRSPHQNPYHASWRRVPMWNGLPDHLDFHPTSGLRTVTKDYTKTNRLVTPPVTRGQHTKGRVPRSAEEWRREWQAVSAPNSVKYNGQFQKNTTQLQTP